MAHSFYTFHPFWGLLYPCWTILHDLVILVHGCRKKKTRQSNRQKSRRTTNSDQYPTPRARHTQTTRPPLPWPPRSVPYSPAVRGHTRADFQTSDMAPKNRPRATRRGTAHNVHPCLATSSQMQSARGRIRTRLQTKYTQAHRAPRTRSCPSICTPPDDPVVHHPRGDDSATETWRACDRYEPT